VGGSKGAFVPVPDFDRTIETYNRSLALGFRSNIPAASIDTVLTAYVEHGLPAYMWDFGPEGFKLVRGRWQPLPDGTPVTYTWFGGPAGGVICMMRQVDAFNPPPGAREEHHDLLFYKGSGPLLVMSITAWCIVHISTRKTRTVNREHAYAARIHCRR